MVRTKVVLKRLRLRRRAAITVYYKSDSEATSSTMYWDSTLGKIFVATDSGGCWILQSISFSHRESRFD
jgi:hypothetical protein